MDLKYLLALVGDLDVPDLFDRGQALAGDIAAYVAEVRANVDRAGVILAAGMREDLDAIHDEAVAVSSRIDAKLADAAKR